MFRIGIDDQIPIIAVDLADAFGNRSQSRRLGFEGYVQNRNLAAFVWEGCASLITEDQKFLLGIHYVDYELGAHIFPVLDDTLQFYPEKTEFDQTGYAFFEERGMEPDPFAATLRNPGCEKNAK